MNLSQGDVYISGWSDHSLVVCTAGIDEWVICKPIPLFIFLVDPHFIMQVDRDLGEWNGGFAEGQCE